MLKRQVLSHSKKWDRTGILLSALCLAHCILLPFVVTASPLISSYFESMWAHFIIHFSVIGVALLSLFTTYQQHRNISPLLLGSFGVGVLITSYITGEVLGYFHHFWPNAVGSIFILSAHAWNLRICHCFCNTQCDHSEHHQRVVVDINQHNMK